MSTLPIERYLELPPDLPGRGFVMQYGYQPGMSVAYRSQLSIHRNTDGSLHYDPLQQDDLESRIVLKVIDRDDADEGYYLLLYHTPRRHRSGGQETMPPLPHIVYTKQTSFGEVLETTEPPAGMNLMLPRMPVVVGSVWREIERFVPPRRITAVEMVRGFHIDSVKGSQVRLSFECEPLTYTGEGDGGDELEATMAGSGEFVFDTQWGVVIRQRTEATVTSREGDRRIEMLTSHTLELVDE